MKKSAAVSAVFLVGIVSLVFGFPMDAVAAEATHYPPKDLKLVGDHWTPWDPPEPGPDDYIIQKGDTLWDLSGKWLGDPFLWPQIWDVNRYILDSHWIYPGDPLVVPGKPTVVPPEGPGEDAVPDEPVVDPGFGRETEAEPEPHVVEVEPMPLVPVAEPYDLYCTGFIDPEYGVSDLVVAGHEIEREHNAAGNVVYLNQGLNQGITAGDEFGVRRISRRAVKHPVTRDDLGVYVRRLGKLRVIAVQDNTATAAITESCEDIVVGDHLVPWTDIPIPMMEGQPQFDRFDADASGGEVGYIVAMQEHIQTAAAGHVIYVDFGEASLAEPGTVMTLFRDNGDLPREVLGQAVVLTVEPSSATSKITVSVREVNIGDRVEMVP